MIFAWLPNSVYMFGDKYFSHQQTGATLLEISMAIALVSIIVLFSFTYFSSVGRSLKTAEITTNLGVVVAGVISTYRSQGNYLGLSADSVRHSRYIPRSMDKGYPNALAHSWSDSGILIESFAFESLGDSFQIDITDVPLDACYAISSAIYGEYPQFEINDSLINSLHSIKDYCTLDANILSIRSR